MEKRMGLPGLEHIRKTSLFFLKNLLPYKNHFGWPEKWKKSILKWGIICIVIKTWRNFKLGKFLVFFSNQFFNSFFKSVRSFIILLETNFISSPQEIIQKISASGSWTLPLVIFDKKVSFFPKIVLFQGIFG